MTAAGQALQERMAAELAGEFPATFDCIAGLSRVKNRLCKLGWRFDRPAEPGLYAVICVGGFPGQYEGKFLSDYMGSGCWEVADPHGVGAGSEVLCWRSKDWSW